MPAAADWNLTDATRNAAYKRKGRPMSLSWDLAALAQWMHPQSDDYIAILVNGDETRALITHIRLSAGTLFLDTDANGLGYGRVTDNTPGAGQSRWNIYADQARTLLVATFDVADNGTGTLVTQTGYTLAGTIGAGAPSGNFDFAFLLLPPLYKLLDLLFDDTFPEDAQNEQAFKNGLATARTQLLSAAAAIAAVAGTIQRTTFLRLMTSISAETTLIAPGLTRDAETGEIEQRATGLLEDERLAMAANTGGSAEMKATAGTFSSASELATGTNATIGTAALNDRAIPGPISFQCIKDLDGNGAPQFRPIFNPDDPRRKASDGTAALGAGDIILTMGVTWKKPDWGIETLVVDYLASVANESSGTSLATTAALWSVINLTSENSTRGKFWTHYDLPTTTLEFYSTEEGRDARDPEDLVTQVVLAASAVNTDFTTQDLGGPIISGRSGAGTAGALVNGAKGTVDFQPPVATTPASRFTLTISETTRPGAWVAATRDGCVGGQPGRPEQTDGGWRPNTGSSPNIDEGYIKAASLFHNVRVFSRRSP